MPVKTGCGKYVIGWVVVDFVISTILWAIYPAIGTSVGLKTTVLAGIGYFALWFLTLVAWTILQAVLTVLTVAVLLVWYEIRKEKVEK